MSLCGGPNCLCKTNRSARRDPPPRPSLTRLSKDERDLNTAEEEAERLLDEVRVNTKRIGHGEITD